jgi:hypothetical protein
MEKESIVDTSCNTLFCFWHFHVLQCKITVEVDAFVINLQITVKCLADVSAPQCCDAKEEVALHGRRRRRGVREGNINRV